MRCKKMKIKRLTPCSYKVILNIHMDIFKDIHIIIGENEMKHNNIGYDNNFMRKMHG